MKFSTTKSQCFSLLAICGTSILGCSQLSEEKNINTLAYPEQSIFSYLKKEGIDVTDTTVIDECEQIYAGETYDYHTYCHLLKKEKEQFLQWLKLANHNPDVKNEQGRTILMVPYDMPHSDKKQIALTKVLLKIGANPNLTDREGKTALMYACNGWSGDIVKIMPVERVRLLLQSGADPNIIDKKGKTALFYAADSYQTEIVPLLLKGGANVNVKDKQGNTALKLAQETGNEKIIQLLKQAGAKE